MKQSQAQGLQKRRGEKEIQTDMFDQFSLFMQYSVAAYCPSTTERKTWSCGVRCEGATNGMVVTASLRNMLHGAAGFVGYNPNQQAIIVSFRGTADIQSAVKDIMFLLQEPSDSKAGGYRRLKPLDGAAVHAGFLSTYATVSQELQTELGRLVAQFPTYKIYFTGHSMGAAISSIALVEFLDRNPSVAPSNVYLYTYGQPRTGNFAWAKWYNTLGINIYRIAKSGDIVPHLPLQVMGYYHHVQHFDIARTSLETKTCLTSGPAGESADCMSDVLLLNLLPHITGYYGWATYPWFC
ncbi:Alpha/Beta hydrolase protein [Gorgonomyces haynaldii]|nr:Alpha/Beta hydrolase protein [Gorgonomyces haynaldii]